MFGVFDYGDYDTNEQVDAPTEEAEDEFNMITGTKISKPIAMVHENNEVPAMVPEALGEETALMDRVHTPEVATRLWGGNWW